MDCQCQAVPCEPNYEEECTYLQRRVKELTEQNEQYKDALLNACLVIGKYYK